MKKISHAIVMVEDIHASVPRTEFSETDLNQAAQLILKMEGVITPPILLQTGIDSYTVVEGNFEYYAALMAEEIEPLKGETINAYVIESEDEKLAYEQQIEMFRQRKSIQSQTPVLPEPPEPVSTEAIEPSEVLPANQLATIEVAADRLAPLEKTVTELANIKDSKDSTLHDAVAMMKTFGDQIDHLGNEIRQTFNSQLKALSDQMKDLQASLKTQTPATISTTSSAEEEVKQDTEKQEPPRLSNEQKFLNALNEPLTPELMSKLTGVLEMVGLKNKKEGIIKRIKSEQQIWPFQSIQDLGKRVKGTGLGPKKIENIVNHWY